MANKALGEVNDLMGKLESGLKTADTMIDQPADNLLVDEQLAAIDQYKRAFNDMVQAGANRENARSKLGDTADNAVLKIGEIEKALLQGDSVTQFNSVVDLSKLIQQARFQVRGYTYSGKVEAEQPALDAIDNALKKISALNGQLPEQYTTQPPAGRRVAASLPRSSQPIPRLADSQYRGGKKDGRARRYLARPQ